MAFQQIKWGCNWFANYIWHKEWDKIYIIVRKIILLNIILVDRTKDVRKQKYEDFCFVFIFLLFFYARLLVTLPGRGNPSLNLQYHQVIILQTCKVLPKNTTQLTQPGAIAITVITIQIRWKFQVILIQFEWSTAIKLCILHNSYAIITCQAKFDLLQSQCSRKS